LNWKVDNTYRPETITCDILTQDTGHGLARWKRIDGFGHMTDAEVKAYKLARPTRYIEDYIAEVMQV